LRVKYLKLKKFNKKNTKFNKSPSQDFFFVNVEISFLFVYYLIYERKDKSFSGTF
jgi:hypothetical protein